MTAEYWVSHIRKTVLFLDSIRTLDALDVNTFLEIGPQPVLTGLAMQNSKGSEDSLWLTSFRRGKEEEPYILENLGKWYSAGADVNWTKFYEGHQTQLIKLPTYPFNREHFWLDAFTSQSEVIDSANTKDSLLKIIDEQNVDEMERLMLSYKDTISENTKQAIPDFLSVLSDLRNDARTSSKLDQIIYTVQWEKKAFHKRTISPDISECWFILNDESELCAEFLKELTAKNQLFTSVDIKSLNTEGILDHFGIESGITKIISEIVSL